MSDDKSPIGFIDLDPSEIEAAMHRKVERDARIVQQEEEITRLRAWRDAINGYLTEAWNSPLRDDEAPLAALKRLIKLELTAMALDPKIHKAMNAALATARRDALAEIKQDTDELIEQGRQDGMEQAAQRCELPCIGDDMNAYGKYFAAAIRAAAGEVKP